MARYLPPSLRQPVWPAVALMLPAVVLALLAVWALARDWRAARNEASARSQELALEAARLVGTLLSPRIPTGDIGGPSTPGIPEVFFVIGPSNELLLPPDRAWPPSPSVLEGQLGEERQRQWNAVREALERADWPRALGLLDAFLEGGTETTNRGRGLPTQYQDLAVFERGLALERSGHREGLIEAFEPLLQKESDRGMQASFTEAGLPLVQLAALKILDLADNRVRDLPAGWRDDPLALARTLGRSPPTPFLEAVFDRLHPLLPELLARSSQLHPEDFFEPFERYERSRKCHAAVAARVGPHASWPNAVWLDEPPFGGIAVQVPLPPASRLAWNASTARCYVFLPGDALRVGLQTVAHEFDRQEDLVLNLLVAGHELGASHPQGGQVASSRDDDLVSAVAGESAGHVPFTTRVRLRDRDAFFAAQRRRQWVFGGVLTVSLAAAVVSALTTQTALRRQQALSLQKSNFVSSVSHELRAPLGSIRLLAEGLERGTPPDEARRREYFELISQETRRLGALVDNVLGFSRIEQGLHRYDFEPTDVVALMDGTVRLFKPVAALRGVALDVNGLDGRLAIELEADGRALQQALLNLLDNALKHSPAGAVIQLELELELEARAAASPAPSRAPPPGGPSTGTDIALDRRVLRFSVQDDGPGIPRSEHDLIFEPFYRLGSELRRDTQGVGIGLSIVRHVVEAHRGSVEVRSEVGQGARFTLVLPGATVSMPPAPCDC